MSRVALIRTLTVSAFALCFLVVVLGAYVRLSAAGLGCPDWPGCYGHLTPSAAISAGDVIVDGPKAWKEMIHRYAAATLGVLIIVIAALAIQNRSARILPLPFAIGLVALVVTQGIFGMLTVTMQLAPAVVTTHLLLGLATLSMLWWLVLSQSWRQRGAWRESTSFLGSSLPRTRAYALAGLAALVVQVVLGGWTSSHYAATGCPDFPKCQGQWWPVMSTHTVAIHFMHRLGAVFATLLLGAAAVRVLRSRSDNFARMAALAVMLALALQLLIGIAMVLSGFPLWIATAHNAGAALLVLAVVAMNRSLRPTWTVA